MYRKKSKTAALPRKLEKDKWYVVSKQPEEINGHEYLKVYRVPSGKYCYIKPEDYRNAGNQYPSTVPAYLFRSAEDKPVSKQPVYERKVRTFLQDNAGYYSAMTISKHIGLTIAQVRLALSNLPDVTEQIIGNVHMYAAAV